MKVADIKLSWQSSVTPINSRKIIITKNGETETIDVPLEITAYMLVVPALGVVSFQTIVTDEDGSSASELYTFSVGDLELPQPDTNLFHEIIGVRDEEETPPETPSV